MANSIVVATNWLNQNEGVLTLILFGLTLFLGWVSGLFSSLRQKPRFHISLIPGPTFVSVLGTGEKHGNFDVHRTCIALYLRIINAGSAGGAIDKVQVGYHWALRPLNITWLRYGLGWFWIEEQTVALDDFQVSMGGDKSKAFPFLTQRSHISGESATSYLRIGEATNGVVYFEQSDSWGGCFPFSRRGVVKMRLTVVDSLGGRHRARIEVPKVALAEARKFNPSFGQTFSELRAELSPFDLPADAHGNLRPGAREN